MCVCVLFGTWCEHTFPREAWLRGDPLMGILVTGGLLDAEISSIVLEL